MPLLSETQSAIVGGYHSDPFAILGPHIVKRQTIIRVFEPEAMAIVVQRLNHHKGAFPMQRIDEAGLFEVVIGGRKVRYELAITYRDGVTVTRADTYAFPSTLSDMDRYLLAEGTDMQAYNKLGAHCMNINGVDGVRFAVWAPNAQRVSVVGNFNQWDGRRNPMRLHPGCGVWELFVPAIGEGETYKYEIKTQPQGDVVLKADPVGFFCEIRPKTSSIITNLDNYQWHDHVWLNQRAQRQHFAAPISVYELHLGSWQRKDDGKWLTYDELRERLIPYIKQMGFTHIELMPVAEHPYDPSWGYQVTGYFAPTSRFGTPQQFMAFVDACHQQGIGVLLDWVPAHFPKDAHGLAQFDGTHLYEHADPRQGEHPDWGTLIFNLTGNEVRQFLLSNALFWLDKYHIDGLRVDAVASMLYLDYSREVGEWIPNEHGGRENIAAIYFLREFNHRVHAHYPAALTIAEESTDWVGVTQSTDAGGLGFDMKWNMGWMHDTLRYMAEDPIHRSYHHDTLTFSLLYAFDEHFMLPFSHDEVVHLKKSMIGKMPGEAWQQFANLRLLFGYQYSHPGKKLLFMGSEFGQAREWSEERSLDWHLVTAGSLHEQLKDWVSDLNHFYQKTAPLFQNDDSWDGFQWISADDNTQSILAYARRAVISAETLIIVANFTPVVRHSYRLGVPESGRYRELMNSDKSRYGGSNVINEFDLHSEAIPCQAQPYS
ncbi:MAG TPA: 1,4-alpha-glucan branching protein GlgB, partial [Anaerolineae bacterium]|nr:1,4-alpha-glucan branching protein GlgB [Anaerolineae bacterium]